MTEVDASIPLQVRPVQIDNPMDVQAKALQLKQLGLQTQAAQRDYQNQNTLANIYRQNIGADGSVNHQAIMTGMAQSGLGAQIPAYQKSLLDVTKTQADIGETNAKAGQATAATQTSQYDLQQAKLTDLNNRIASLVGKPNLNRQDVIDQVNQLTDQHALDPATRDSMISQIPQNPGDLKDFLVRIGTQNQTLQQQLSARASMAPQVEKIDTGAGTMLANRDPLTGTITQGPTVAKGVSPDTQANIAKDYATSGLNPDGTPGKANQSLVDMIGTGRIVPSDRLESTPRGQAILAAVDQQYPGYDRSTAQAKVAAAKDFTTGKDAAMLRSIGTATKHLDMLDGMVSALGNGNTQVLNKLGNAFAAQTGATAPTNFDAAKEIVGQEVIKGIVAGGGGVTERQEAASALSNAKTPAQLRGVISTYKSIMGAQHESLLQQRDAAGLPRSTLPDYTEGANNAPAGAPTTARPPLSAFGTK